MAGDTSETWQAAVPANETVEVAIESIGSRGDGVGRVGERLAYIAGAAPGDRVRAEIAASRGAALVGRLVEVVEAGALRIPAPCRHFGACGGCALQHVAD